MTSGGRDNGIIAIECATGSPLQCGVADRFRHGRLQANANMQRGRSLDELN